MAVGMRALVLPRHKLSVQTLAMVAVLAIFAIGLVGQPERWLATPAYGNLMVTMAPPWWGFAYLIAAVSLALSTIIPGGRLAAIATHMWPVILLAWWELAFIVRWTTDSKTTVVNVVSWGTYLTLVVWSAVLADDRVHA